MPQIGHDEYLFNPYLSLLNIGYSQICLLIERVSSSTCLLATLSFYDLFISDIFKNTLRIFPEIEMSVESSGPKKRKLNGKTDYTVGFGKDIDIFDNTPPRELPLKPRTAVWMKMICDSASLKLQLYTNPERMQAKQSVLCVGCFQMQIIGNSSTLTNVICFNLVFAKQGN